MNELAGITRYEHSGWVVHVVNLTTDSVRVTCTADGIGIWVDCADSADSVDGSSPCGGLIAHLAADGQVVIDRASAPPAIVLAESGALLVPQMDAPSDRRSFADGDRLLFCSSSVFDPSPAGVAAVVNSATSREASARSLLRNLLSGANAGGGAVAARIDFTTHYALEAV